MFVYEGDRVMQQIKMAGGIADCIALFLQQFFLFKVAAAAIMTALFILMSLCLDKVYASAAGRSTTTAEKFLCCLPAALLFVYTEGKILFITGHVAIVLSSVALLLGTCIVNWKKIAGYLLIPVLVVLTGFAVQTAVWPMIVALILYSLLYRKNYIAAGVTLLSAFLMVALARYLFLAMTSDELFSPDIYTYRLRTETIMPWVWGSIVVLAIIPFIFNKFVAEKINKHIAFAGVVLVAIVGMTSHFYKEYHDEVAVQRYAMQHWIDTGDYQSAMDFSFNYITNTYTANIYFMLLSQNSELENEVGGVLQQGQQLIMAKSSIRLVRRHLMALYYYLGYVNGAQREAFEYNEPSEGMMVPAAIKILAQTNIAQGNYALAEKYLNYLDHTLFYSDWAQQYRKFLYNDKAVESDPELGPRRKAANIESVPQTWTTLAHVIRQIAFVAPELPATNYKKAFLRLGEYNKPSDYDNHQQSFIQY